MDNPTLLHIRCGRDLRTIELPPEGILLGRSDECGATLPSDEVAEKHARVFLDPFGRWVIEAMQNADLAVNGRHGRAFSIRPGDRITIGPFVMRLSENVSKSITPPPRWRAEAIVDDDDQTLTHEKETDSRFSPARLDSLDNITNSLSSLTEAKDLYPEACIQLGKPRGTVALVVKVPKPGVPLSQGIKIIAHSLWPEQRKNRESIPPPNIHLSRTVLEAVRTKKTALSATSEAEDVDVRLSLIDDMAPRMVLAAPIAETKTGIDVLYVDQLALTAPPDSLGFFAIVARMVNLTRKTLIMAEERAERKVLDHQLETAQRIQSKLMPKKLDLVSNVASALHYKPALWVGGDYCDLLVSIDNRLVFALGDVSGKGLPAAMVMANLQAMLRSILLFNSNPQTIVAEINDMLCDTLLEGMFITLLLGFLDPETGELEYVNAGHELPLLKSSTGRVAQLGKPVNYPLGILKNQFIVQRHIMARGESLLVVSDGVTETFSPDRRQFGVNNLMRTVQNVPARTCQELIDAVVVATDEFRQYIPPTDDFTILALKWQ